MLAKERAKRIRQELKERAITNKDVTVRTKSAGYDEVITIKINNLNVDMEQVKNIAKIWEKISYDHSGSGEILNGANVYINVGYDSKALREAKMEYMEIAKKILKENKDMEIDTGKKIAENEKGQGIYLMRREFPEYEMIVQEREGYNVRVLERQAAYSEGIMAEGFAILIKKYNMKFI